MANICLINTHFPPYVSGGAENYALRVAKGLQSEGHEVSVIATKPYDGPSSLTPEQSEYEGLDVYYFYPANLSHKSEGTGSNIISKAIWHQIDTVNPHSWKVIKDLLKDISPDIIHTHNVMGISTIISKSIRATSAKHVHTLHDYSLICPKSNLLRERTAPKGEVAVCEDPPIPCKGFKEMKKLVFGTPDIVTAPSEHILNIHKKHGFFKETPCKRLQLGLKGPISEASTFEGDPSVLFVGKHLKAKGLDTLYKAAMELPDVTFHICGSGPYDSEVKRQAEKQDHIIHHGFVDDDRLEELRREASVAVVPSIWMENSPLTIYESFASGLPVIGSDIGGIPELIEEGKTGWLVTPGDPHDLATTIREAVDSDTPEVRENTLQWARRHLMENHIDRLMTEIYGVDDLHAH